MRASASSSSAVSPLTPMAPSTPSPLGFGITTPPLQREEHGIAKLAHGPPLAFEPLGVGFGIAPRAGGGIGLFAGDDRWLRGDPVHAGEGHQRPLIVGAGHSEGLVAMLTR